jgi:hypothetical protein
LFVSCAVREYGVLFSFVASRKKKRVTEKGEKGVHSRKIIKREKCKKK